VALAPCAILVAVAGRFPRTPVWTVLGATLVALGGAAVIRQNWIEAGGYGRNHRTAHESVRTDVRNGVPADLIARRHPCLLLTAPEEAAAWNALWKNDAGAIRGAAPPVRYRTESL